MYVSVQVPADDTSAKFADMKELLAPRPAGYVPYGMRVNGCDESGDDVSYAHKLMLEHPEVVLGAETVIRKLMEVKNDVPFVKELLNGLYGVNSLRGTGNNGEPDPAEEDRSP